MSKTFKKFKEDEEINIEVNQNSGQESVIRLVLRDQKSNDFKYILNYNKIKKIKDLRLDV